MPLDDDFVGLCEAISAGDCIAFVGAGFSAGVAGGWGQLPADITGNEPLGSEALRRAFAGGLRPVPAPAAPTAS